MKYQKLFVILISTIFFTTFIFGCGGEKQQSMDQPSPQGNVIVPDKRIDLWNGKDFAGWDKFIPDKDVDVSTVWMVKDGILHCTGVPIGYIKTKDLYANYKLTVVWRWPAEPGNSGVLLHMSEPDEVWPKCIEAQLKTTNAGDFYLIGGTTLKEQVDK